MNITRKNLFAPAAAGTLGEAVNNDAAGTASTGQKNGKDGGGCHAQKGTMLFGFMDLLFGAGPLHRDESTVRRQKR